eukprot:COSAG01_NODE_70975_length_257_cov_0.658228_1_plen_30_part_01
MARASELAVSGLAVGAAATYSGQVPGWMSE